MVNGLVVAVLAVGLVAQAAPIPSPATTVQDAVQQADRPNPWPPAGVLPAGAGITSPRIIKETKPGYTAEAMRARIQGSVEMQAVVEKDGTVGQVIVTRSLDNDLGLDRNAVDALKQWKFHPGTKDGAPVRVLVTVEMSFTIRDKR